MSDYIPDDVWPQILEKSTPETLIRCRCVCKSWKSLISSQRFMAAHLAAQKPHLIIKESTNHLQQTPAPPEHCVAFRPETETLPGRLDLRFLVDYSGSCIVGSVIGVVCLAYESFEGTNHVVVWNPSIQKSVYLPWLAPGYTSTVGFGVDASKNELKVVRIARVIKCGLFGRGGCGRRIPPNAEVYSVREGRWRTIDYEFFDCHTFHNRWSQCLLNGAAHWPAYSRARKNVVLSFHFKTEEFAIIQLPPEVEVAESSVSKLGDLLAVLHYKRAPGEAWARGCDVWAMRKYGEASSWCKMASVGWDWEWGGMGTLVWVREDAGELIVSTETGELLRCNTRDQEAKPIGIQCEGDGSFADGFVRSLVLLDV